MNKAEVIEQLRVRAKELYGRMVEAVTAARDAATDPDSKAESKWDTRGLEASYLAAGQAGQADELAATVRLFGEGQFKAYGAGDVIGPGALVEAFVDDELGYYLLAAKGGGLSAELNGCVVSVLTPGSTLRSTLEGMRVGEAAGAVTVLEIC